MIVAGFDERYEISCSGCGVLHHESTLREALETAGRCVPDHTLCADVMVYDRMAHNGRPEIYEPGGKVRSWRPFIDAKGTSNEACEGNHVYKEDCFCIGCGAPKAY